MAKKRQRSLSNTMTGIQSNLPGKPITFNPDYSPVIKDLRRIGALAGTFIVILIILTFFLR